MLSARYAARLVAAVGTLLVVASTLIPLASSPRSTDARSAVAVSSAQAAEAEAHSDDRSQSSADWLVALDADPAPLEATPYSSLLWRVDGETGTAATIAAATPGPTDPRPTVPTPLQATANVAAAPTSTPPAAPTPAATATRTPAPARLGAGVSVLMYHYVRVNPDPTDRIGYGLSIDPALFRAHAQFLAERGFRAIPLRDAAPPVIAGTSPSEKTVVLTFDDGYRDFYDAAWPILKGLGHRATVFAITDLIGHPRYLTADQIKELDRAGVEIGSHSVTHADLATAGPERLRRELRDSRQALERLIGGRVLSFCYPSGRQNAAARAAVREAGYAAAVTVEHGTMRAGTDSLQIPRVRIYGGMGLAQLARLLGEPPPDPARWAAFLSDRPAS